MQVRRTKNRVSKTARLVRNTTAMAVMAACASGAMAYEFQTDGGWTGTISTQLGASSAWRVEGRDKTLIHASNAIAAGLTTTTAQTAAGLAAATAEGFLGGNKADTNNLNYDKGDRYSTMFKFITDLELKKGDSGALFRVKGWYDQALKDEVVPVGHQNTGYAGALGGSGPARPLSDETFDPFARFDGLELLDAYVYTSFDIAGKPAQLRIGNQALNWGESVFIQGINQISPLDLTSARKGGVEIKEVLLPIWAVSGSVSLGGGVDLGGFYQLKWTNTVVDACGTYWGAESGVSLGQSNCNMITALARDLTSANSNAQVFNGPYVARFGPAKSAKNRGQYGLTLRFPVEAIDTEFGLYAMNIHSRVPTATFTNPTSIHPNPIASLSNFSANLVYPEDVKIFGVSAATNLAGWSLATELSYQKDVAVSLNGNDAATAAASYAAVMNTAGSGLAAALQFASKRGPAGDRSIAAGPGGTWNGYDLFNKTQFQFNGVRALPTEWVNLIGAVSGSFIGEVGFQWNNVPDAGLTGLRYLRDVRFGYAPSLSYGGGVYDAATGCIAKNTPLLYNVQPDGRCTQDGFVTDFAWGYRVRAAVDYPNVFGGWVMSPSIFFAHDVDGTSMDSQFVMKRKVLALGLKFNLNKVHDVNFGYQSFLKSPFDANRDHDNVSVSYSYTF